jgi:hypothetical protein
MPMKTKPTNLPDLLGDIEQALDDWIVLDSEDALSSPEFVKAAWRRIEAGGGTLSFVTNLRERVSKAIEELKHD